MMQSFSSIHPHVFQLPSQKKSSARPGNERGAGGGGHTAHTAPGPLGSGPERLAAILGCSIANCHRATGSTATRAAPTAHEGLELEKAGTRRQRANTRNVSRRVSITRSPRSEAPGQTRHAAGTNSGGPELRGTRRAGNGAGPRGLLPRRARRSGAAGPRPAALPPRPAGITRGYRPGAAGPPQDGLQEKRRGTAAEAGDERAASMPNRRPRGTGRSAARSGGARGPGDARGTHSRGRRDAPKFCPLPPFADRPSATNPGPRRKPRPRPMGRRVAGRRAAIGRQRGRPAPRGGRPAAGVASCALAAPL